MDAMKHDRMIEILRTRFDYTSARAVMECALAETRTSKNDAYTENEVDALADWLERKRDRAETVAAALREEVHRGLHASSAASRLLHAVGETLAAVVKREPHVVRDDEKATTQH